MPNADARSQIQMPSPRYFLPSASDLKERRHRQSVFVVLTVVSVVFRALLVGGAGNGAVTLDSALGHLSSGGAGVKPEKTH